MILFDTHTHTDFSSDSQTNIDTQIKKAISLGLTGLYITDHMDLGYPDGSFILDLKNYTDTILKKKESYRDKINLHLGIELGLRPEPDITAANENIVTSYPFDYTIGSIHVVDGLDPYYKEYWDGLGEANGILHYYHAMYESILYFQSFDTLGHMDYIIRYAPSKEDALKDPALLKKTNELIDEILYILIKNEKALELNTAGWKYGLSAPNPNAEIIKRYLKFGGKAITVGSDGHKPEHLAWDFLRASKYLKELGVEKIATFKEHKPIFHTF